MNTNRTTDVRSKIQLYNAGAGSGKTHTITERIIDAIRNGVDPQKIVAMTFTEKAARELKERITLGIKIAAQDDPALVDAVRTIEFASIGTIHAVCFSLVKKFCFEVGISPDPQVMSEESASMLLKDAVTL
ncbi:MAG: hypothetical protein EOP09_18235, partial [Proteobacteria bacterium]